MLDEKTRLTLSHGEGSGLMVDRQPDARHMKFAPDILLVSADNHLPLTEDIFHDRFPEHLKDRAPRIWWDEQAGIYQMGFAFKPMFPESTVPLFRSMEARPALQNFGSRMGDLDGEGVEKEIVFPQSLAAFFSYPDYEVREHIYRAYNEYLAELQAQEPDRFFPVGVGNWWEPDKAAESIRKIKALGLKSFMLPSLPGKREDGSSIFYNDELFDPLWSAAVAADIPVCFHVSEDLKAEGLGGELAVVMYGFGSSNFRRILSQLIFGKVFDRFPDLRVVFAEAGISWVAGAIQDAEMLTNQWKLLLPTMPDHRPSYYWHKNCYATFMADNIGLRLLDVIGADRIMWGTDYPHNEGSFGYTHEVVRDVIAMAGKGDAKKILGETAMEVFRL